MQGACAAVGLVELGQGDRSVSERSRSELVMLLGLSGSLREGATNTLLLHEAARHYGAPLELADIRFPLFDADLQDREGVPDAVIQVAEQIRAADAILVATPEYNQSLSGVLKNALDWISRVEGRPWEGKPVVLMSAASGRTGGARASYALRLAMTPFRARLISQDILVADGRNQFDEAGRFVSERYDRQMADLMAVLRAEVGRG